MELDLLLDSVQREGYQIVTVSDLPRSSTIPEFSGQLVLIAAASLATLLVVRNWKVRFAS
jgi:hypothetical protein